VRRDKDYKVIISELPGKSDATSVRPFLVPRRHFLAGVGTIAIGGLIEPHARNVVNVTKVDKEHLEAFDTGVTSAMYIVAHPDDSLLFQSPDLLQNVQSGLNVMTVHLTAGDNGEGEAYWSGRESGIEAAYAQMAGVDNVWTTSTLNVGSHALVLQTLTAQPNISVVYMRLPDGNDSSGYGTALYGYQSLKQLWQGTETTITAVDSSNSYNLQDLIGTIATMINAFQPQLISTLDFVDTFGDGDHMDHYTTGLIVQAAHQTYTAPHTLVGYMGYPITSLAANVTGSLLATKQSVFYTYGAYDVGACTDEATCAVLPYAGWLARQYVVGTDEVSVVAVAGAAQTVASGAAVTLNGAGSSDPNQLPLTYAWIQTAGAAVTLSSATAVAPTFTAPTGPAVLTFSLTVSSGTETSAPATVTITVAAPSGTLTDVAPLASASASSQNTSTGQLASSTIDGVISGYPTDNTAEWATVGGGVGSWLKLAWPVSYTISDVVLFDRPNLNDQITSGTLTFSNGTVVSFGALPNNGATGLTVTLAAPIATTSVLMTVTGVSSTTLNVGLSEIQAFGTAT
jgi:LmbE family N-acetylglucosaminyl deacetylase